MKTYTRFLIMNVFCLLTGWCGCYAQDIHFTLVAPPKDAPWSQIVGMSQGPEGFLWIATQAGLYKYDGHRYTSYLHDPTNSNSIADNRLYGVLADKNGIIWIGTYLKGLDRLDPVTGNITHFQHLANDPNTISNDTVTSIMQDKQGMLWIGTFNGLNRYNPKTKAFTHYYYIDGDSASLSNNLVNVVYEDHAGAIWVGTGTPFSGNMYKGGRA
jgi:ligand-binding sensor domain-containing protein